jgi:uncharacterized protein with HEPN domain
MRGKLGDKVRLNHVLEAIVEIEIYLLNIEIENFKQNSMMRFACIKQLEIIGEACNHVTSETKLIFSDIEWAQVVGMRNVFVHEYFGIDTNIVWEILKNDLPIVKLKISQIIKELA